MSYIQFIEKELQEWLDPRARSRRSPEEWVVWENSLIELVEKWVTQSYRNGQRDCPRCNPKPQQSRGKK